MVHNYKIHGWKNHPDILELQRKYNNRKVTQEEIDEVKAELATGQLSESKRHVEAVKKSFNPAMTFWLPEDKFKGVVPVLRGKRRT